MDHVRWTTRPTLHAPVVIAAFEGWNDAGDAASTAARYLVDRWDADLVADVDPEEFYDFTSTRPEVRLDDDGLREIVWPATEIHAGTIPGGDQDVLRDHRHRAAAAVAHLLRRAHRGRRRATAPASCLTLGALLAEVPHTRPDADRRHGLRARRRSPASSSSRRATRAPPASSACSTTPGATPGSARRRCGPRCPPTCPARRRPRPRWR